MKAVELKCLKFLHHVLTPVSTPTVCCSDCSNCHSAHTHCGEGAWQPSLCLTARQEFGHLSGISEISRASPKPGLPAEMEADGLDLDWAAGSSLRYAAQAW